MTSDNCVRDNPGMSLPVIMVILFIRASFLVHHRMGGPTWGYDKPIFDPNSIKSQAQICPFNPIPVVKFNRFNPGPKQFNPQSFPYRYVLQGALFLKVFYFAKLFPIFLFQSHGDQFNPQSAKKKCISILNPSQKLHFNPSISRFVVPPPHPNTILLARDFSPS